MALPLGVGLSIFESDVHHWKLAVVVQAGARPCRVLPTCAWNVLPPLPRVIAVGQLGGYLEHHSTRLAHGFWQAGNQLRVDRSLCHSHVARGFDKGCKF